MLKRISFMSIVENLLDLQFKVSESLANYPKIVLVDKNFKEIFRELHSLSEELEIHPRKDKIASLLISTIDFWHVNILTSLQIFLNTSNIKSNLTLLHVKLLVFV
jgi:hypothetical protein